MDTESVLVIGNLDIDFMTDWEADTEIIAFYSDNEESRIDE